jgi:hypothetical protein
MPVHLVRSQLLVPCVLPRGRGRTAGDSDLFEQVTELAGNLKPALSAWHCIDMHAAKYDKKIGDFSEESSVSKRNWKVREEGDFS